MTIVSILPGMRRADGKTLGTDLRKGKFTLPVLIFLRSASEFEREHCCQLILEEQVEEMIELLKNGATNGALNESIAAGSDLIREAQAALDGIASNPYAEALFCLGDALCEMFDQLRSILSSRLATQIAALAPAVRMSQLKIREMPQDERPREKLLARGPDALTNPELIAILLRTGRRGMNVIEVARELLEKYRSFAELSRCSVKELREIKGIGPAKALELVAAFNLGKRFAQEPLSQQKLDSPELIHELLGREMRMLHEPNRSALFCSIRVIV